MPQNGARFSTMTEWVSKFLLWWFYWGNASFHLWVQEHLFIGKFVGKHVYVQSTPVATCLVTINCALVTSLRLLYFKMDCSGSLFSRHVEKNSALTFYPFHFPSSLHWLGNHSRHIACSFFVQGVCCLSISRQLPALCKWFPFSQGYTK